MDLRNHIKSYMALTGWTLTDVVKELNARYGTNTTPQNLSNKLSRGTIKYTEVLQIADIIGYTVVWSLNTFHDNQP